MTTSMQEFEYVSIAMDGEELSDEMLDKLLADDAASQKWYEYHLISDCMKRQQQAVGRDADFMHSANFKATLAEISAEHRKRHVKVSAGAEQIAVPAANQTFKLFALAASVAAVAVAVWQFPLPSSPAEVPVAAGKAAPQPADNAIVSVSGNPDNRAASAPVVVPNAAKNQLPERQTTVRTESKTPAAQTVVQ